MYSLTTVIAILVIGTVAGGGAVWLVMTVGQLRARIVELEQAAKQSQPTPAWAQNLKLDHRAQLANIATLSELALGDLLDATIRLSPEAARRAVEKHVPQLFNRENIK